MSKTEQKHGNRASLLKILSSVMPEADFNDEEVLFGRILYDYNSYAELLDKESDRRKADDALEADYKHNTSASMAEIDRIANDENLDPDEVEQALAELKRISAETAAGNYTIGNLRMMLGVMHRAADIEAARREGEIAGRNATIDERLASPGDSDGLPMLAGASTGARAPLPSIFDIAAGI